MRALSLLALLVVVAGCIGPDDPVDTASADVQTTTPTAASPGANPTASAASSSKPPTAPTAQANATQENATAPPADPVLLPYAVDGSLPPEACVGTTVTGCAGLVSNGARFHYPEFDGVPLRAKLELAWTAAPDGVATMQFALIVATPCDGEGCWNGDVVLEAIGGSPLVLDGAVPELADGKFLVVGVRPISMVPEPGFAYAHNEQPFAVAGSFTVQP